MTSKTLFGFTFLAWIAFSGCKNSKNMIEEVFPVHLEKAEIERLIQLSLSCVEKEWPNKLNQVLSDESELGTPRELHPVFYGCFDWHSAVHAHWTLVKLYPLLEDDSLKKSIQHIFSTGFTPKKMATEIAYFERASSSGWERPYGWGWLLKLGAELHSSEDDFLQEKYNVLAPLCGAIRQKFIDFLPKLIYPNRSGEHSNIAFGMSLAWDYAEELRDIEFQHFLKEHALRLFSKDKSCPLDWEPSGYDFLSPCLEEAYLMSKVLSKEDFSEWLAEFLLGILDPDFDLEVAQVSDREDGKLVHLDGLNFSRARCLYGISSKVGNLSHLVTIANEHLKKAMLQINDGHYAGEHWLASFAVAAFTEGEKD
jgi:hypothetical protein